VNLLLEGVVGSTAYGLNTPTSDIDYTGIYVEPTEILLGLHPPSRERATKKGRNGADATYHEIGKALSLMLSCNPTASEVLWLDEWTHASDEGLELVSLRECFLSAHRVRNAFFGYAVSQFHRLIERGRFQGSLETRREKHARHTMRVLWQGYELYTTGELPIRAPDPAPFFAFGEQVLADPEAKCAKRLIEEYEAKFNGAVTALPDEPHEVPIEDFLLRVRRAHLDVVGEPR